MPISNAALATSRDVYSNQFISELTPELTALRMFAVNCTDEIVAEGTSVEVGVTEAGVVSDFDAKTNNYDRSKSVIQPKMIKVTLDQHPITGFALPQDVLMNFRPTFWKDRGEKDAEVMAASIQSRFFGMVTAANFGDTAKDKVSVVSETFNKGSLKAIRIALPKKNMVARNTVLALNPTLYAGLLDSLDANTYGGVEAIRSGVIPRLLGFKAVVEVPTLEIPGFACHGDALVMASREIWVADKTPYRQFTSTTEENTGMRFNSVILTDGPSATTSYSTDVLFGVAVGNGGSLIRLLEKV